MNGDEGIPVPGPLVRAEDFERVYSDPAADGRSRGAGLSDLFWYWLAPGPQMHQEHLEPGPRYHEVALTTRRIVALPAARSDEVAVRSARTVLDRLSDRPVSLVRLRDLMMPIWAQVYYELVFDEACPAEAEDLIVANADDVVTALKCCGRRHMDKRDELTRYLLRRIQAGDVRERLPERFTDAETAFYLQGAFFNTAIVQLSEAMAHLLLLIAQHPHIQAELADNLDDDALLDRAIDESLRVHPLFGIAHRIISAPIELDDVTLPEGSVLLFNYLAYQRTGPAADAQFDPGRWVSLKRRDAHFVPFGVTANRACPARGSAPVMMRAVAREVLGRYRLDSSVQHTRSLPSRGPCLLSRRQPGPEPHRRPRARLWSMWLRDRAEDVGRSIAQLGYGTYMVWDARRLSLCTNYFAEQDLREANR